MADWLYDVNSVVVAAVLFGLILAALLGGRHLGNRHASQIDHSTRENANSAQGALLGLLALLMGFTFSQALGRFDARSSAVVEEANAIGTAWLRADLIPETQRTEARDLMREYLALRIEAGAVTLDQTAARAEILRRTAQIADRLWNVAAQSAVEGGSVPLSFAVSVNAMFDAFSQRDATVTHHVPQTVMLLLFITFVGMGLAMGYCAGIAGARPTVPVFLMITLTVVTVYIVLDLDRPRRGLIKVDQSAIRSLAVPMGLPQP